MGEIGFYEKPEVFKEYESLRILIPVYPAPEDEAAGKGAMYINSEYYLLAVLNYCYGIIRNNISLSTVLPTDPDDTALLVLTSSCIRGCFWFTGTRWYMTMRCPGN